MKKFFLIFVVLLFLFGCTNFDNAIGEASRPAEIRPAPLPNPPTPYEPTLRGAVLEVKAANANQQPVSNATVKLYLSGNLLQAKKTGADGKATFNGILSGGRYRVTVSHPTQTSIQPEYFVLVSSANIAASKKLFLDVTMAILGNITFSVTDSATRQPLSGVQGSLFYFDPQIGGFTGPVASATSGTTGVANFGAFQKGVYRLEAFKAGYKYFSTNTNHDPTPKYIRNIGVTKVDTTIIFSMAASVEEGGRIIWERFFGGAEQDVGVKLNSTTDGGYIFSAGTDSFNETNDYQQRIWAIKTDQFGATCDYQSNGECETETPTSFAKFFGSQLGQFLQNQILEVTPGQYVILRQNENEKIGLIKIGPTGAILWKKVYDQNIFDKTVVGESYSLKASSFSKTSDGGFIIFGSKNSISGMRSSLYLLKTDSFGGVSWVKEYFLPQDLTFNSNYYGGTVLETYDGGFAFAYSIYRTQSNNYAYIIKTDSAGNTCEYGTDPSANLVGCTGVNTFVKSFQNKLIFEMKRSSYGGYIVTGSYLEYALQGVRESYSPVLMKITHQGALEWETPAKETDGIFFSVSETIDGGYITVGLSTSFKDNNPSVHLWIVKTDRFGNTCNYSESGDCKEGSLFSKVFDQNSYGTSIVSANDGTYTILATIENTLNENNIWLLKYLG